MGAACTKDAGAVVGSNVVVPTAAPGTASLPLSQLNDDVLLIILSFVSYAPFENDSSGTMTLSTMRRREVSSDGDTKRLVQDYNECSSKLTKSLRKRSSSISPFRAPQQYYQEAFHGAGGGDQIDSRVTSARTFGTLTHVLPLVNKRLHRLCKESNMLWLESMERLLGFRSRQSRIDLGSWDLWEKGLRSYIAETNDGTDDPEAERIATRNGDDHADESNNEESAQGELQRARELIVKATTNASRQSERSGPSEATESSADSFAREVFRQVHLHHKQVRLPVFTMRYNTTIGEEVILRLFEPRYQLLIADIMADRSDREKQGFPLRTPRPRFLFACKPNEWRERAACIVEIRQCTLHHDGTANVILVPVSWVLMQDLSPRPDSGGLVDATVVRSPKRKQLPVFCMRSHVALGQSIGLQFFEERYKRLIAEVMAGRPESERNDSFISLPRPQFLFSPLYRTQLKSGSIACVVDVERCWIQSDGRARLSVVPIAWVLVETLRMRPRSSGLFDATVLRPGAMLAT